MKILYHHRIKSLDGQYVHIEEMVRELRKLGHEVRLVGPVSTESKNFGKDAGMLSVVKRLLPGFAYEMLEFSYCFYDFIKVSYVAWRFRPDIVYERYNLFMPSGIWAKRLLRLPLILEVNSPLVEERSKFGGLSLRRLAVWTQRFAWCGADKVITVTGVLRDKIAGYGADPTKIEVIANGVDLDRFGFKQVDRDRIRNELALDEQFVVGFTGFVREWHRLDNVVEMLAEDAFSDAVLLIIGDGPARENLQAQAEKLGVGSRVLVTGIVERDRVREYISAFDIALQANVVAYASPLKVLEYLAVGRAVVAPDSENIRELLTDGYTALLFENGNASDLRDAMKRLKDDPDFRSRLGRNAHDSISFRGLTWRRNAERTSEMMADLVEMSKHRPLKKNDIDGSTE